MIFGGTGRAWPKTSSTPVAIANEPNAAVFRTSRRVGDMPGSIRVCSAGTEHKKRVLLVFRPLLFLNRTMAIRIVRLGTPRQPDEGVRFGTVRRPPRGVAKNRFAKDNWYDVWLPNLAPSAPLLKTALHSLDDRAVWSRFVTRYKSEMAQPENSRLLDALAALSHQTNFSVGCYCEDEHRCHRGILRQLLKKHGASVAE